jgi:hypothetical protein
MSYSATKTQLISAPVPSATRTYKPISHQELIELTVNSILDEGFHVDKELYSSAREGNVANARYTINNIADKDMQLQIGWQNSYDKTLSAKFAIGTLIFICGNGSVSGDFGAFKKKHKGDIQEFVPTAIVEYIKRAGEVFTQMQKEKESMKKITLSRRVKSEILGRLFADNQIITATQLGIIAREIEAPTHNYGDPDSMWSMYNYTTFAAKEEHPSLWMQRHIDLHDFFAKETQSVTPAIQLVVPDFTEVETSDALQLSDNQLTNY